MFRSFARAAATAAKGAGRASFWTTASAASGKQAFASGAGGAARGFYTSYSRFGGVREMGSRCCLGLEGQRTARCC